MVDITLIPKEEFERVRAAEIDKYERLQLIADMCRANTLAVVKRAGSGHLGTSLSAMDIVVALYYSEMNTVAVGIDSPDRDIYFSSKGHDVPGLYSVFYSLGIIPRERFLKLRRFGGLDGHPEVGIPGIEANSGSLGMGISKGRGMSWAKAKLNHGGRVFVMTGDGELQEGQNYEAFQSTIHQHVTNLNVIIDHNKVQSDKPVAEIVDLGNLDEKLGSFGWHVYRCDGHDFRALEEVFEQFKQESDKPKILIADTIKGRGVSFMEHPTALQAANGLYPWHAGAPDDKSYTRAYNEVITRIKRKLRDLGLDALKLEDVEPVQATAGPVLATQNTLGEPVSQALAGSLAQANTLGEPVSQALAPKMTSSVSNEYVAEAYGEALLALAPEHPEMVVLDGDLASDCRVRKFENAYPESFIENGIAEQDMVSMAGGLARQGLLPVVNSFASFLAARANEQIYNNASEKSKIIYACHYAGLIPAGPGKSHQSIRDISLFGALPNVEIIQPCNAVESRAAVEYAVAEAKNNVMLRLIIGPSPRIIELPEDYALSFGKGATLTQGDDAVMIAYGPVMLHEALKASEILAERGFGLRVINMPWLNRIDADWLRDAIGNVQTIFVLEDHAPVGGLGDRVLESLVTNRLLGERTFTKFAVEGWPACGTPVEALAYHRLDGASLAGRVLEATPAAAATV